MIIIASQDEKTILNFKNVSTIQSRELIDGNKEVYVVECFMNDGRKLELASYENISRGKEVFSKFVDFLTYNRSQNSNLFLFDSV